MEVTARASGGRVGWGEAIQVGAGSAGLAFLVWAFGLGLFGTLEGVAAAVPAVPFSAAWLAFSISGLADALLRGRATPRAFAAAGLSLLAAGAAAALHRAFPALSGATIVTLGEARIAAAQLVAGVGAGAAASAYLFAHDEWAPRAREGARVGNTVVAAAALFVAANVYSSLDYIAGDWTKAKLWALSAKTTNLLRTLPKEVQILVVRPAFMSQRPENAAVDEGMGYLKQLLKEFEEISPRVTVEWLDPYGDPHRVEEIAQKYSLGEADLAEHHTIVTCDGKSKSLGYHDLLQIEYPGMERGRARLQGFKGEAALFSAIDALLHEKQTKIYVTQGRGEFDLGELSGPHGGGALKGFLEGNNLRVEPLDLSAKGAVPGDCDILVVAGPEKAHDEKAIRAVGRWLDQGGKALVFWEAPTERDGRRMVVKDAGLGELLGEYGVRSEAARVMDVAVVAVSVAGQAVGEYQSQQVQAGFTGDHPIVAGFGRRSRLILSYARPLKEGSPKDPDLEVVVVARSSPNAYAESRVEKTEPGEVDPPVQAGGDLPLALVVQPKDGARDPEKRRGRPALVVVGDSDFAAGYLDLAANKSFLFNAVQWLASRQEIVEGMAPKNPESTRLTIPDSDRPLLFWILCVGPVAVFLGAGLSFWSLRSLSAMPKAVILSLGLGLALSGCGLYLYFFLLR